MKTKTIALFDYDELSPKAKEAAHARFRNNEFDDYGLQVHLDEEIQPLLEAAKIVPVSTADKKYPSEYASILYSLSCCQGDGAMFEGTFAWRGWTVNVRHSGRYCHSYSKTVEFEKEGEPTAYPSNGEEDAFEESYQKICAALEKSGYAYIDSVQSEGNFSQICAEEGRTFREDGTAESEG